MIPRIVGEIRQATAKPEPLTSEQMTRLQRLINENAEKDAEERMSLQLQHDLFMDSIQQTLVAEDEPAPQDVLKKIRLGESKRRVPLIRGSLQYAWVVAIVLMLSALAFRGHQSVLLWASAWMLRMHVAEAIVFGKGFTRQKLASICSIELAYPLYCWMAMSAERTFNVPFVVATFACACLMWAGVLFLTFDTQRPSVKKSTKTKTNTKKGKKKSK